MNIREKINLDYNGLVEHGPITIVAFGDSMTHGAEGPDKILYETVYWNRLRKKINAVRDYVPVNVINAGIGGITAINSLDRMESQVLCHNPDLVIVSFGLNDVNLALEDYLEPMRIIFSRCIERGIEVIFMTPNMLNTRVAEDTEYKYMEYAHTTADYQNSGRMDRYMEAARNLANKLGVTVCDCYSEWKKLSETQDVTLLLANRINHPTAEMHELFADRLFRTIFGDDIVDGKVSDGTMFSCSAE